MKFAFSLKTGEYWKRIFYYTYVVYVVLYCLWEIVRLTVEAQKDNTQVKRL